PLLLATLWFIAYEKRRGPEPGADRAGARANYIRCLLAFVAALLCKSSVVMFPVVLLLFCWWREGRITTRDFKSLIPFFATSFVLGLVTLRFQSQRAIADLPIPTESGLTHVAAAGLDLGFYFLKCIFPHALSPVYARWELNPITLAYVVPWIVILT